MEGKVIKMGKKHTWKELQILYLQTVFEEYIEKDKYFRKIYYNVKEGLESLPDEPCNFIRNAVLRELTNSYEILYSMRDEYIEGE